MGATALAERPTWVYEVLDRHGGTIYVGMTCNLEKRMSDWRTTSQWFKDYADPSKTRTEQFPNRSAAAKRESYLIALYCPPFNSHHNRDQWLAYADYREGRGRFSYRAESVRAGRARNRALALEMSSWLASTAAEEWG